MTNESIISDYMESESSFLLHGNIYDLEGIHQSGYTKFSDIRDWMLENSARSCQSSTNISIIDDWFDACQIYIPYDSYNLFKTKHLLLPDVKEDPTDLDNIISYTFFHRTLRHCYQLICFLACLTHLSNQQNKHQLTLIVPESYISSVHSCDEISFMQETWPVSYCFLLFYRYYGKNLKIYSSNALYELQSVELGSLIQQSQQAINSFPKLADRSLLKLIEYFKAGITSIISPTNVRNVDSYINHLIDNDSINIEDSILLASRKNAIYASDASTPLAEIPSLSINLDICTTNSANQMTLRDLDQSTWSDISDRAIYELNFVRTYIQILENHISILIKTSLESLEPLHSYPISCLSAS